jgi:sulfite reductase (NADPH) hemoprotein beta-component
MEKNKLSEVEHIKDKSQFLRGTLEESLVNPITGALFLEDSHLIKFHGSYQQADRDLDSERKRQKLEPLYSFMIRVRLPGGIATPQQWLRMDELSTIYGNNTLKLTTRQAFQLHGIYKKDLKTTIQGFNEVLLDSIAGCGDVNRNVMSNPNPYQSNLHDATYETAKAISAHLTPKTSAYWEIWLNGQAVNDDGEPKEAKEPKANSLISRKKSEGDAEPIYGKTYLPRKFKIAIAVPPHNDTDIFSNDIGLIAIEKNGHLIGYNVAIGGGLGMTFGMLETYPRLADLIGFVETEKVVDLCEKIVTIQRDWGNRENRKFSRLKYTIDRVGLDVFKTELSKRLGYELKPTAPYAFKSSGDAFGWSLNPNGNHNLTLFIEGGRIQDVENYELKTALRTIAQLEDGDFRLTGNQNLMICNILPINKKLIQSILNHHGVLKTESIPTGLRLNSIACVALPTCTMAFAEAERYLPQLIDKLDMMIQASGLEQEAIVIRMTGCPNGCGRPYLGEIGLVGKSMGRYNLYLGAAFNGDRLNKLYKEMLDEAGILATLQPIIADFAQNRLPNEHFGDFTIRKNYVKATVHGQDFHH